MPELVPDKIILEVQVGRAGSTRWQTLTATNELFAGKMAAPGGGARKWTRFYATDYSNNEKIVAIARRETGSPEPFTFDITLPDWVSRTAYNKLRLLDGVKNIRLRYYQGDYTVPTNYVKIKQWNGCVPTARLGTFDGDQLNGEQKVETVGGYKIPQEADEYHEVYPVALADIKGTVTGFALQDIISIGYPRNAGDVEGEDVNNDGLQEYIAVGSVDGSNLSHLWWTANKGASWTDVPFTGFANFNATGVAKVGPNIIVSGTGTAGGLMIGNWEAIKAGGSGLWARCTNIAANTQVNRVRNIGAQKAIAVGTSGSVWKSDDSGQTFSTAGTAVTANALTRIAVVDETLQWFGGASGTLVRRLNEVMSTVAVTGISTNAINALAVPPGAGRATQVFVGAADGNIYYSANGTKTTPTWSTRYTGGTGAIDAIEFSGYEAAVCWIVHSNGSSQSRLLRDLSGGVCGADLEAISTYTSPANATFNAIAAPKHDVNTCMVVGDVTGGQGFIGLAS